MENRKKSANEEKVSQSMADFLCLAASYNCLERDRNISHIKIWQAVSTNLYLEGRIYRREYYSGSLAEGMPRMVCNDSDILFTLPHWPTVLLEPPPVDSEIYQKGYVLADASTISPSFLTLRIPPEVKYMDPSSNDYSKVIRMYVTDVTEAIVDVPGTEDTNQKLLGSAKFVKINSREGGAISGPADKRLANPADARKGDADFVACLICPDWPPCASEFLTRPRQHGWPSQCLLERIKREVGCHVVAVGPHDSLNKDVEWSWAFSMAEKELSYDICDKMYSCMYLLRAIKNKHWIIEKEPNEPSIFSSYLIKAASLWICEETTQDNDDIIGLVDKVIDWLLNCFKRKYMPHYIITGANLIGRLREDKGHFQQTIEWLEDIKANLLEKLHTSIEYDKNVEVIVQILDHIRSSPEETIPQGLLKTAQYELRRGGEAYSQRERYSVSTLTQEYCMPIRYSIETALEETIKKFSQVNATPKQPQMMKLMMTNVMHFLSKAAEKIFSPIYDELPTMSRPGYEGLTRPFLCRHIGEAFHVIYCLLIKYKVAPQDPAESDINNTAVKYYTKGLEMTYPNGWSDKGLGGLVLLSKHYYITEQWTEMRKTLTDLEPLLMEAKESTDILKSLPYVNVDHKSSLATEGEHQGVSAIWDTTAVHRHPVFIGFYLLEMLARQQGNAENEVKYRNKKNEVDKILKGWE